MSENQNPETPNETTETKSRLAFLKNRNVRIALAATAVAGTAFVVYKTKSRPETVAEVTEEVVEAAVSAA